MVACPLKGLVGHPSDTADFILIGQAPVNWYNKSTSVLVSMLAQVVDRLGKPYFASSNCLIYNMDCIEGMAALRKGIVNLAITSPPYNIGKEYESTMEIAEYVEWCSAWLQHVALLIAEDGAFWLNLGYIPISNRGKAVPIPYLLWDKVPMFLQQEVVWNYGAGVAGKRFFSPRNEKFLWYLKNQDSYTFNLDQIRDPNVKYPNQKKNGKIKVNPIGKNPSDVWEFPKVTSGAGRASKERTPHPAQFPIAVIDRIILGCSNPSDLIMDPFLGSGTTAAVALRRNRSFVGFEIRKDYCDIACERISQGLSEQEELRLLPDLQQLKPRQENLDLVIPIAS
jgi:adenine-specific DNA-methyltransferase